jgi:hypothetical protein
MGFSSLFLTFIGNLIRRHSGKNNKLINHLETAAQVVCLENLKTLSEDSAWSTTTSKSLKFIRSTVSHSAGATPSPSLCKKKRAHSSLLNIAIYSTLMLVTVAIKRLSGEKNIQLRFL